MNNLLSNSSQSIIMYKYTIGIINYAENCWNNLFWCSTIVCYQNWLVANEVDSISFFISLQGLLQAENKLVLLSKLFLSYPSFIFLYNAWNIQRKLQISRWLYSFIYLPSPILYCCCLVLPTFVDKRKTICN